MVEYVGKLTEWWKNYGGKLTGNGGTDGGKLTEWWKWWNMVENSLNGGILTQWLNHLNVVD